MLLGKKKSYWRFPRSINIWLSKRVAVAMASRESKVLNLKISHNSHVMEVQGIPIRQELTLYAESQRKQDVRTEEENFLVLKFFFTKFPFLSRYLFR